MGLIPEAFQGRLFLLYKNMAESLELLLIIPPDPDPHLVLCLPCCGSSWVPSWKAAALNSESTTRDLRKAKVCKPDLFSLSVYAA